MISVPDAAPGGGLGALTDFRQEFSRCLTAQADALFELTDAVWCAEGPVTSLVELSLVAEHRRGHGALYDALAHGRIEPARLRRSLTGLELPRAADGRVILTVEVSPWLRPDAASSPDRLFCHVYGRGKGQAPMIPGWPYSFVAALEPGRSSWTALLDAVRLSPDDDPTLVTAGQIREVIDRLRAAGHGSAGDVDILIVLDAGYDVTRLALLLSDLPVVLLGRLRSDRVSRFPAPPRQPGTTGRPPRHGPEFALSDPATQPTPEAVTSTQTTRYGTARACAWTRCHPPVDPPWRLDRPRRTSTDHHRQHHPADRGPATRGPSPDTGLAVVLAPRTGPHRRRPALAGVSAPCRHRTHVPVPQADAGLDPPPYPHPPGG